MNNEFVDIYLNIINEAWDRFSYEDIIKAVKDTTNDCTDPWVKGESGATVLALLKQAGSHKRGNERIRHSELFDDNDHEIIANDDSYITMYWRSRSKSGNSFDSGMFNSIWTYCAANEYGKSDVVAQEVGKLAYGIWKALNSRNNKIEKNLKEFAENGFEYQEGQKIENVDLIIKDVTTVVNNYRGIGAHFADSTELVCKDPTSGFKYKIRLGKNTSKAIADLFSKIKRDGMLDEVKSKLGIEKVNVSGKILRINKEYKSVTMNFVTINSPTDTEVKFMENQYYEIKANIDNEANNFNDAIKKIKTFDLYITVLKNDQTLKDNAEFMQLINHEIDFLKQPHIYKLLNDAEIKKIEELESLI